MPTVTRRNTRAPSRTEPYRDGDNTLGAVYVEFLIAFIPFFVMVLGMIQLALMYSAHLIVQHAATTAARAAIVVFPDCEHYYGGAAQMDANGGGRGSDPLSTLTSLFGSGSGGSGLPTGGGGSGGGSASGTNPGTVYGRGGGRLDDIRFAANLPLVATSPSLDELRHDDRSSSLIDAIGGTTSPLVRLAMGALAYNNIAVAVTFPDAPHSTNYVSTFSARGQLTTRVTYLLHCGVPIVSAMACDDALQLYSGLPVQQVREAARALSSGHASPDEIRTVLDRIQVARNRLAAARPGLDELGASRAGYGLSAVLLTLSGGHYSVIRAEATMPLQGTDPAVGTISHACFVSGM